MDSSWAGAVSGAGSTRPTSSVTVSTMAGRCQTKSKPLWTAKAAAAATTPPRWRRLRGRWRAPQHGRDRDHQDREQGQADQTELRGDLEVLVVDVGCTAGCHGRVPYIAGRPVQLRCRSGDVGRPAGGPRAAPRSGDQEMVQAFPAHGANPPLGNGVGVRGLDRRTDDLRTDRAPEVIEGPGELALAVAQGAAAPHGCAG